MPLDAIDPLSATLPQAYPGESFSWSGGQCGGYCQPAVTVPIGGGRDGGIYSV
jgi:hypothetical protein